MKEYGKFHALSFALNDKQEQIFTDLSEKLTPLLHFWFDSFKVIPTARTHCKTMEKYLQSIEDVVLLEKVKYFSDNLENILLKLKTFDGKHRLILHGDANNGNIMFRNKEHNAEVRFIDFQGANSNSLAVDLTYFFYGFASSEDNLAELDFFLEVYYNSFSKTIGELESDPEKLCPASVIKEHWKQFSVFGLLVAFISIAIMVNYTEIAVNVNNTTTNTDTFDLDKKTVEKEREYVRRIKYLLKHFTDNNFI